MSYTHENAPDEYPVGFINAMVESQGDDKKFREIVDAYRAEPDTRVPYPGSEKFTKILMGETTPFNYVIGREYPEDSIGAHDRKGAIAVCSISGRTVHFGTIEQARNMRDYAAQYITKLAEKVYRLVEVE